MPGLEESPKTLQLVETSHSRTEQQSLPQQEENPPVRETTQTDKLNQRLLKSFLNRMNAGDFGNKFNSQNEDAQTPNGFED